MASLSLPLSFRVTQWRTRFAVMRWTLVWVVVALWLIARWLKAEYGQEDSNLWLVMELFFRFLLATLVALITTALVTALAAWLYFLWQVRKGKVRIDVSLGDGKQAEAGPVPVRVTLEGPVVRPPLGSLYARLYFSGRGFSNLIRLSENVYVKKSWRRRGVTGVAAVDLFDTRLYDVGQVSLFFYDMLGLISLPATLPVVQQLYTVPRTRQPQPVATQPHATEEQTHRIQIPRRVEGEYINYKEFEPGDNIQRIVWKIYARSGQLVVRIPETRDPYASHVYLYVSYFHGFEPGGRFDRVLLNHYKHEVRHLLESVAQSGYQVRLPADQEIPKRAGDDRRDPDLFQISACQWHATLEPSQFVQPARAAMVCVSSCVPVEQVKALANRLPPSVPIVLVRVSAAWPSPLRFSLRHLFFRPERQPGDELRQLWLLSPLRRNLLRNERALQEFARTQDHVGWMESIGQIR